MISRTATRRLPPLILAAASLVSLAALTGCGGGAPPPPPPVFKPLDYSYLPPIRLNIANLSIQNDYVPDAGAQTLLSQDPDTPLDALTRMLQHRIVPDGMPGSGVITINNASIEPVGNTYVGTMSVRIDVRSPDGRATGFTEASVSVTQTAPDADDPLQIKTMLYSMTKQMMDAMNVQLQYHLQRDMGSWISYGLNAAPAAVSSGSIQSAPLGTPGAQPANAPAAPQPLTPPAAPTPAAPQPLTSTTTTTTTTTAPGNAPLPVPLQPNGLPQGSLSLGTLPVQQ